MKLLLDANLSHRLTAKLLSHFEECYYVDYIGLALPAQDIEIWNFAKQNNLTIVTNDSDFYYLLNQKGFPPKIILLKTGNQSNSYIESLLKKHYNDVFDISGSTAYGFLEIL